MSTSASASQVVITPQQFLAHWQAHRRLTRRVIDAFPADKLFTHSIGGMRTFGEISKELLGMATPTVAGILTDQWGKYEEAVDKYDQALAIYPSNPDLWAFKAITLSGGLGRNEEALECWERAKKLDHVLADAITDVPSSETTMTVHERDLVDFKGSTADRIRNLVKQQAMDKKKK